MELASKRKLGFVTGRTVRDNEDKEKQEQWDTCNNMIIGWNLNNRSNLLMMSPLPTVEMARSFLQQEEVQRDMMQGLKLEADNSSMYSKYTEEIT
ncbi:putative prolyl 4-hydroxylase 12 [Bienertia sinuspersici]